MKFEVVAAALLAPLAVPGAASAQAFPYQPAVVSLVSGDSSITATITNPNDQGICTLTISSAPRPLVNDPNDHSRTVQNFTEDNTAWPHAGQTVELTRGELSPGIYDLSSLCGNPAQGGGWVMGQFSTTATYEVRVGAESKPVGSLMFGS